MILLSSVAYYRVRLIILLVGISVTSFLSLMKWSLSPRTSQAIPSFMLFVSINYLSSLISLIMNMVCISESFSES